MHQSIIFCLPFLLNPVASVHLYHLTFNDCLSQPKSSYVLPVPDTSSWKKCIKHNINIANVFKCWGSKHKRILRGRWWRNISTIFKRSCVAVRTENCSLRNPGSAGCELPFPFATGRQDTAEGLLYSHPQKARHKPFIFLQKKLLWSHLECKMVGEGQDLDMPSQGRNNPL